MESLINTFRLKFSLAPMAYVREFHDKTNWSNRLIAMALSEDGITFEVGGKNKKGKQIKDAQNRLRLNCEIVGEN